MREPTRDRGLSPVVGAALMVAIFVTVMAVAGAVLIGYSEQVVQPDPDERRARIATGSGGDADELTILHTAGSRLDADDAYVQVRGAGGTRRVRLAATSAGSDGVWSPGEELTVTLNGSRVCASGAESVEVTVVVEGRGGRALLDSKRVPVDRGRFEVRDGAVVPATEYTAEAELVGVAAGPPGPPVTVTVNVTVGPGTTYAWTGGGHAGGLPAWGPTGSQPAGTAIAANATSAGPGAGGVVNGHAIHSRGPNSDLVRILLDGDPAPNGTGPNQQNAATAPAFLAPHVSGGTITLDANQTLFLYELEKDEADADDGDFYDVAVLVTLDMAHEVVVEGAGGQARVRCPRG